MSLIFDQIQATIGQLTSLEKAKVHFDNLMITIQDDKKNLADLQVQVEKEARDVEKFEGMSVTSIFHKVLGNKEEQLEKERQEYLEVALKFKELKKSIEISEYELEVLKKKMVDLDATRAVLEDLKKKREQEIISNNESSKVAILAILKEIDSNLIYKEELIQAHAAGKNSMQFLESVSHHLQEAIRWGDWDMSSNNRYYDHMKHTSIDSAVDAAYQAKHALTVFNNELADVGYNTSNFTINLESFTKFSDIFFDNLISDWIIQNKIKNVYSSVDMVKDKVLRMIQTLETDYDSAKLKNEELIKEKDLILLSR